MSNLIRYGAILCALALCVTVVAPPAASDEWNKKTVITLGEPLQIPGMTLQPGKYVFKLADSQSNRHIVQVFNEDESRLLTTILAIPNQRLQPKGDTELGFWETPKGTPPALRAWFYPGDNFGQEFEYPKTEAAALSASTNEQVPAMTEEDEQLLARSKDQQSAQIQSTEPTTAEAQPAQPEPAPEPAPAQPAQEAAPAPAPQEAAPAPQETPAQTPEPAAPAQQEQTERTEPETLPRTAGYLPLLGLTGLLSVCGASLIRHVRTS